MIQIWNCPLRIVSFLVLLSGLSASAASAETIGFNKSWDAVNFRNIPKTNFSFRDNSLIIQSNRSASVIYSAVPPHLHSSSSASWSWSVEKSVPPTDIAQKGGDDRNIALYFVFTDKKTAARAGKNANIKRLLSSRKSRLLIYVFGGSREVGSYVPSPYFRGRGTSIITRKAGVGSYKETVDLAADFKRAFGTKPDVLVGLAVSSDSDDTGASATAKLSPIHFWPELR